MKKKYNIIGLLFSILTSEIIFASEINSLNILSIVAIIVFNVALFIFFDDIANSDTKKGTRMYIVVISILIFISVTLALKTGSGILISTWLLGGGVKIYNSINYIIAALIIIVYFSASICYYFSTVRVRVPALLLIYFIAIIMYIKSTLQLPSIIIYMYSISFLLNLINKGVVVEDSKIQINNNIERKDIFNMIIKVVFVILIISSILPKNKEILNVKEFEEARQYINGSIMFQNLYGLDVEKNMSRNINESSTENADVIMYKFSGSNPGYLINHSFDTFDGMIWSKGITDGDYGYSISSGFNYPSIKVTAEYIKEMDNLPENMAKLKLLDDGKVYNDFKLDIVSKRADVSNISHPSNIALGESEYSGELNINKYDEIFKSEGGKINRDDKFSFTYYYDTPSKGSLEEGIMKYFNDERYKEFIYAYNNEDYKNKNTGFNEVNENYKKNIYSNTSIITTKAYELTKNAVSNYEKAEAICNYFKNGEFKYNLDLPKNNTKKEYIEFFLEQGKEGYCVQYATAMTLLCRAAGIPAKYVEGYLLSDTSKDSDGYYSVSAKSAHAFVQIYIPGYGWKIFDPTPSLEGDSTNKVSNIITFINESKIIYIVIVIGILYFLGIYLWKKTFKIRKLYKLKKKGNVEYYEGLLKDILEMINENLLIRRTAESPLQYANRIDRKYNFGLEEIVSYYYDYKYALKGEISSEDVEKVKNIRNVINKEASTRLKN